MLSKINSLKKKIDCAYLNSIMNKGIPFISHEIEKIEKFK